MSDWLKNLLSWFFNLLTNYEPFLSGFNNLLGILAVGIAVIGFILGWWKRLWVFIRGLILFFRPSKLAIEFPFEIVRSRTEIATALFPQLPNPILFDYDIPYMERRTEAEISNALHTRRRVVIAGVSSRGKTRITLELASNLLDSGFTVLIHKPHAWLDAPILMPEDFNPQRLLVVIDGLERYLTLQSTPVDKQGQYHADLYANRLSRVIQQLEAITGSSDNIWVICNARADSERWQTSGYDATASTWNSFPVIEVPSLSDDEETAFIDRLAKQLNIEIPLPIAKSLAEKNDGSFYPLIVACRQWNKEGISRIGRVHVHEFEGKLGQIYERRYHQHVTRMPSAKFVYAALDILARAQLPAEISLVGTLTTALQNRFFAPFISLLFGAQADAPLHASPLTALPSIIGIIIRLILSIPAWMLFVPWIISTHKAIKYIQNTEIPTRDGILQPREGQIDGRGKNWYTAKVAEEILSEEPSKFRKALSVMVTLASEGETTSKIALISAAIRLAPSSASLYHRRAHLYLDLAEPVLARNDIERAFTLEGQNPVHYVCAHTTYSATRDYDKALRCADKYLEITKDSKRVTRMRARTFREMGDKLKAIHEYDQIIDSNSATYWDFIDRAEILREMGKPEEAFKSLEQKLEKASKKQASDIQHALGHHFEELEDRQKALYHWTQAIKLNPQNKNHYLCRAQAYLEWDDFDNASIDCLRTLKLDSKNRRAKGIQARIHYLRGEYTTSRRIIEDSLLDHPRGLSVQITYIATLFAVGENYDSEAQLLGRLLAKEAKQDITESIDKLNELLARTQSRRSQSRVIKIASDSIRRHQERILPNADQTF